MTVNHQVFTQDQKELLTAVLNQVIPAEGQFPGAGDLGVADFIEQAIGPSARLRRLFADGLTQIEITAVRLAGRQFTGLSSDAQRATLEDVEARHVGFFGTLVRQCYNGYYTSPQIFQLIGYHRAPPQEYQHRPFDESLLEPQRQRQPFWRQV